MEVVQYLLAAGADVNVEAEGYRGTALQAASEIGNLDLVNILLIAGATLETTLYGNYNSSIQLAIAKGYIVVGKRLLGEIRSEDFMEPGQRGRDSGIGVLHAAALRGHEKFERRLLAVGVPAEELDSSSLLVPSTASKGYTL